MKNNHEITLKQYAAYCEEQPLYLGTAGSYGMEMLTIIREGVWAEYDILATFHPPVGDAVQVRVGVDNQIDVPAEATAKVEPLKSMGKIVFAGYKEGVRQIAVDVLYKVAPSSGASGTEPAEPTPYVVQQILSAANGAVKTADGVREDMDKVLEAESGRETAEANRAAAESARVTAETARAEAESKRADAEQARVKAESTRVAAETARKDAESKRANAEQERQTAEEGRVEAESSRVKAEAEREKQLPALKSSVDELRTRQNILVGSETGNPIAVDDAFAAPLCGLTVYGKSTQDGTPTPDAPVPIVSAGDGVSVAVRVTGANMLEGTKPGVESTVNGITYTIYENGVLITGTATDDLTIFLHRDMIHRLTRGIYYLTTRGLSPSTKLNFYFIGGFSSDVQNRKVTLTKDVDFSLLLQILKGATLNTTVQVSLTRNKIATYSPYHEQILTLSTPNGLPGIPVTSGGNYTDQSGQQWVCDEVDFGKSVKVQRIDKGAFDSTKTLAEQNVILATPVETPLTPAEIAAYKALTAYAPDTVVQASDGAGIKLDYQRDVNLVVKNLEDAIASMTTT